MKLAAFSPPLKIRPATRDSDFFLAGACRTRDADRTHAVTHHPYGLAKQFPEMTNDILDPRQVLSSGPGG
ncbi:MAG: hypothetical protein IPN05_06585 [Sulfuritalea sp.]|nr:hypothetical protein [Sulfuritalea sp.]